MTKPRSAKPAAVETTSATSWLFESSERFRLDHHSPVPLYHQMERIILDRIAAQGAVGWMLPREMDLIDIFGVSRATVKKVTDSLSARGLIQRRRAVGTRIVSLGFSEDLSKLTSYTEQMRRQGLSVSTRVLEAGEHEPAELVRRKLRLGPRERTFCIRRLRGTNEVFPVVLLHSEIPASFGLAGSDDFNGSLYDLLEQRRGIRILYADQDIRADRANAADARLLGIGKDDPVLVMERVTYTTHDQPLEWVRAVYRPEHYTYTLRLRR
jgi:GntR family transcriptional regulator